jgi:hypothetical protein
MILSRSADWSLDAFSNHGETKPKKGGRGLIDGGLVVSEVPVNP